MTEVKTIANKSKSTICRMILKFCVNDLYKCIKIYHIVKYT